MVDVCELAKFAASGKTLRLVMDIAAALERYRIAMEGPEGVRLRKLNRIRTIRGTTVIEGNTLTEAQVTGDAAPFVDFMLNVILRTVKARGVPKDAVGGKKSRGFVIRVCLIYFEMMSKRMKFCRNDRIPEALI